MKSKQENKCHHRKTKKLIEFRKNYWFGKKSKPSFTFKRIFGEKCEMCGLFIRRNC